MNRIIILALLLAGCSTSVPMVQRFPAPPTDMAEPAPLDTLQAGATMTNLLQTMNTNYARYHEQAAIVRAWNRWYKGQSEIGCTASGGAR
jgi:PBP1b-binding outer membrane lipoprotein LpoB